ncbi:regulatory protein RecX [Moraxella bovis]|uniref:regulatory protein RecX n=1 Tax=Moraxella bovis TaxID=476 RepID=UPI0022263AD6|nr:RecX family transcriptional regulator [Moraxella bovis]UYZ95004.1 RecX family transcriptional regulator [Moraxella bovis]UZA27156.1 RecX family transcriptional regulator [Moraxella bovis]WAJ73342.1 RecX family transcriptional regulator [Moraxella bovis]
MIKPIKLQTLDDILADMGQPVSAKTFDKKSNNSDNTDDKNTKKADKTNDKNSNKQSDDNFLSDKPKNLTNTAKHPFKKSKKTVKNTQNSNSQTDTPTPTRKRKSQTSDNKPSAVGLLLKDDSQTVLDDNSLKLLSQVEIEKLQLPDKETRYLRWLAFYYLSKKELSRHELKTKLISKDCDPQAVDDLLDEFAEKGYQSDTRCATMLVREAVRKGRGVRYLTDGLKKAGLDVKAFGSIDELIAMSDVDSVADGTILDDDNKGDDKDDEIDWLKLAVEARCKKYGDTIPKDPKEKARQLRFLQHRGFEMGVCFDALKMNLGDFE